MPAFTRSRWPPTSISPRRSLRIACAKASMRWCGRGRSRCSKSNRWRTTGTPAFHARPALPLPHPQSPRAAGARRGRVWHIGGAARRRRDAGGRGDASWDATTSPPSARPIASPTVRSRRSTADVAARGEEIHVEAAARSFLHHQVRSMVGCLALVGRGQWQPARHRQSAGSARPRRIRAQRTAPRPLFRRGAYP